MLCILTQHLMASLFMYLVLTPQQKGNYPIKQQAAENLFSTEKNHIYFLT